MSCLDLTLPLSKIWVQVVWTLEDRDNRIDGLGLDLNLVIEGSPTLVGFGAGSTIYGQQKMELVAGMAAGEFEPRSGTGWVVRKELGSQTTILAALTAKAPPAAEGWAHLMDARKCTVVAVSDFGRARGRDEISTRADGQFHLIRDFSIGDVELIKGPKSLAFWLHFVPMPVQVGAATSHQSILAPLRIESDRRADGSVLNTMDRRA